MVHLFSDASQKGQFYAGAFIIAGSSPIHVAHPGCKTSTEAELLTLVAAISEALKAHDPRTLIVHTDVEGIQGLLNRHDRKRQEPGATLYRFQMAGVTIVSDGNKHPQHRICHRHSRIAAGIIGSQHPALKRHGSKQGSTVSKLRRRVVLEQLCRLSRPVSEVELAARCRLPLSAVSRALEYLRKNGVATVTIPANPVDACDCAKRVWESSGASLTLLLK